MVRGVPSFFRSAFRYDALMSTIVALSSRPVAIALAEGDPVTLSRSVRSQSSEDTAFSAHALQAALARSPCAAVRAGSLRAALVRGQCAAVKLEA